MANKRKKRTNSAARRKQRYLKAAANVVLKNIARVTWRETGGQDKTLFVNIQTLRIVPLNFWYEVSTLFTDVSFKWCINSVTKSQYHAGVYFRAEEYVITAHSKLADLYDPIEALGQKFIDSQRADTLLGIGAIVAPNALTITPEQAADLVELAETKGLTDEDIKQFFLKQKQQLKK